MVSKQRRTSKRCRQGKRKQGDRKLIALMDRSLEGAIDFIERMTGERLTQEEIEELKWVLPKTWLHKDPVH